VCVCVRVRVCLPERFVSNWSFDIGPSVGTEALYPLGEENNPPSCSIPHGSMAYVVVKRTPSHEVVAFASHTA
jgi:hypothetical protein